MFRWIVLTATVVGMFAYGYTYDNPVALQHEIITKYNLSNVEYNLLYTIYSIPNIILPFCTGIISDKIGEDCLIIFFFGLMVVSQMLFSFGCSISNYGVMLLGRFLFGIGAESHALVETPLLYFYFKGKELAFALALHLSMVRAGSSLNDYLTYIAYKDTGGSVVFAVSVSVVILFVSWIGLIVIIRIHRKRKKHSNSYRLIDVNIDNNNYGTITMEQSAENENIFNLKDIKEFDSVYWLLTLNCGLMYGVVIAWMNIGTEYLQQVFGISPKTSNVLLMIPYSLAAILQPFCGYLSDLVGKRTQFLLIASILFVISHYLLTEKSVQCYPGERHYNAIVALVGLGVAYSIFTAVIWPSVALVVKERALCTAYGIPCSFYNLILTLFTICVGILTNQTKDNAELDLDKFSNVQSFLLYASVFAVLTSILLLVVDFKSGKRLNIPAQDYYHAI